LEAALATLSSNKIYDLIGRLFNFARRDSEHATFDIVRVIHPTVRAFANARTPCAEIEDRRWLARTELCSPGKVIEVLEQEGFAEQEGRTRALFVDPRCGHIQSLDLDLRRPGVPMPVSRLLHAASVCHAEGLILATNDPSGKAAQHEGLRQFTMEVYRKGAAINVYLLDHFVLTAAGWKRMFALRDGDRI
jgi:DNA repair protein RadC